MRMHIWNTRKLRDDLVHDRLDETDGLKYMLAAALLWVILNYSALWFGGYRHWTLLFEAGLTLAISIVGTHEAFLANGAASGRDFVRRYCVIAVPIGFKVLALNLLVATLMYFGLPHVLTSGSFRDPAFVYRLLVFATSLGYTILYYMRIAHHLRKVAAATSIPA
eukprot:TRINITY_DN41583_c0_g1_i1.p2 TRINITY_DN41583_c0_g1~~TRINITY_DN41583_c0_g1_i1.p2  ORF type:complete len:165 (-),score=38.15 TRINITY_DN41583_c0_g1_i1:248-742(-)